MSDMKSIVPKAWEVQAILEGRKTVTRKPVKGYALEHLQVDVDGSVIGVYQQDEGAVFPAASFAPYQPGDILFVRETWGDYRECEPGGALYYMYRADYPDGATTTTHPDGTVFDLPIWHPSIHMPQEAARLFLRVTGVRVERLQDIDDGQAKAEGARSTFGFVTDPENEYAPPPHTAREDFQRIWDSTTKPKDRERFGWAANPWVWVIEFERISKEEALGA